jgi:hypothetical protein
MQLKKYHRKRNRNLLIDVGTPNNSQLVPRWQMKKTPEAIAEQLRSRHLNPNDPLFNPEAK